MLPITIENLKTLEDTKYENQTDVMVNFSNTLYQGFRATAKRVFFKTGAKAKSGLKAKIDKSLKEVGSFMVII